MNSSSPPAAPTRQRSWQPAAFVTARPGPSLFLVGFLLLFFQLACIRWFGSTVVFLTFFTNIVLLATFLGMSAGCLAAGARRDWTRAVIPLFLVTSICAAATLWASGEFGRVMVGVGGQGSPQQVYFGTEYRPHDVAVFVVPIEFLAALFFVLVALVFAGIGQVMGCAFAAAPDRLRAYTCNIAGSLAGIAGFTAVSYLRQPPVVWFAVVIIVWLPLLRRRTLWQVSCAAAALALVGTLSYGNRWSSIDGTRDDQLTWSPYYKVRYVPAKGTIETNNISHQEMFRTAGVSGYQLPYLLNRDAGGTPFEEVLVIGAGSGNDVAAALANGATHVDAVEIDPAIYEIGRANHPDRPYQDPRVTVHIGDGRSFLRTTNRKYDLVVYALVDSLVLHSGYSNLRLESFLFTEQAFADISARLSPRGVFSAYNFYRRGWIVGRIDEMAERTFHSRPLVMSLPFSQRIDRDDELSNRVTFILTGREAALAPLRRQFQARGSFWINATPARNLPVNGFAPEPPAASGEVRDWLRIAPSVVDVDRADHVPTDNWPFLYLRNRVIPGLNLRNMLLLAVLSLATLDGVAPGHRRRPNWQMFFLGAGFMLIETKGVVHMALLFGSTWIVNAMVFFAILVMILASNLYVARVRPARLLPYYLLLIATLAMNVIVTMNRFLALPDLEKIAVSCLVIFAPVFFAGVVFGTLFRDSQQPDLAMSSNIAGAMVGGLAETLSLVVGFDQLLTAAILFYVMAATSRRIRSAS